MIKDFLLDLGKPTVPFEAIRNYIELSMSRRNGGLPLSTSIAPSAP
jgi:hypothetical protein